MEASIDIEAQSSGESHNPSRSSTESSTTSSFTTIDDGTDPDVTKYGDTSATYWKLYGSEAESSDRKYIENLRGDTSSMVFLNSLFSSIVASFIIEIYKNLLPDSGQQTVDLLSQLVSQSTASQSPSPDNPNDQPFNPPSIAIRINIVLFLSFFLSMMSAVACALIQQWCNEYLRCAYPRAAPHECGRVRTFLYRGLTQFQMRRFMYGTHVLLHISVFLFFWSLSDFFYTVHVSIGNVSRYCLITSMAVYLALSIFPLIFSNSPYNTPLTLPLRASILLLVYGFQTARWRMRRDPSKPSTSALQRYFKGIRFDRAHLFLVEAKKKAANLEHYAMEWLLTENDFSDRDMDKFLEGLPGYISSRHTKEEKLDTYIMDDYILERLREHLLTCATSSELSDEECISRVLCCIKSLRLIFGRSIKPDRNLSDSDKEKAGRQMTYVDGIIRHLQSLCTRIAKDPVVALRAACVRALAIHGLLAQVTLSGADTTSDRPFPMYLIPLRTHFFHNDTQASPEQPIVSSLWGQEAKRMWENLLSNGPLVNLTMLADAVRSAEQVPHESLSFCWKVLDLLVKQLGVASTAVSESTHCQFNSIHERTKEYVEEKERGFRIAPLLHILDAVARGRRLSLAFSDHPEYHRRADVVFGKEHLRNGDLLAAFARSLPDYILKISPEEGREFMEGIVCDDNLWTSLQVNLWNAQRSDHPTPDKHRTFEDCCTVLDVALSSLENSTKVDWRAPEFGSLAQQFESFIAHCFQNSFMGRATGFRVGVVRARCSKVLLAQFCSDIERDGTIFFRSQWDIASLARLFWSLGIGGGKDAEFWSSYLNGGQIEEEFMTKARETIGRAARDGPLLIFCKLGRLTTTAVPFNGSGLEIKDLEKVSKLQRNMIEDERLPLNRASDKVWESLRGLREDVSRLRAKLGMSSEDGDRLAPLLQTIDDVLHPGSDELCSSRHGNAQVLVTPALRLQEQRTNGNQWSFSSESTAVTGRRLSARSATEDSLGEPSKDTAPDLENDTQAPSSSSITDDADSDSVASPSPTTQKILNRRTMDPRIGIGPLSTSLVNHDFTYPSQWDSGQLRVSPAYPRLRRNSSGPSISRPDPSPRTPILRKSRSRTLPSVFPRPTTSSPLSSDIGGPGQPGTSSTSTSR